MYYNLKCGMWVKNAKVSDYELSSAFLEGAIMPDGSKYKSSVNDIAQV